MKFKILDFEPENVAQPDGTYHIRWWKDYITGDWIIQVLDSLNNEVDVAYAPRQELAIKEAEIFKHEYNTEDARKYKRGE